MKPTQEQLKEAAEWQEWKDLCDWSYEWYIESPEEFNKYYKEICLTEI